MRGPGHARPPTVKPKTLIARLFPLLIMALFFLLPMLREGSPLLREMLDDLTANVGKPGSFARVEVLVAVRKLQPGDVLKPEDLRAARLPRKSLPADSVAPLDVSRVVSQTLLRPLVPGQPLSWSHVVGVEAQPL